MGASLRIELVFCGRRDCHTAAFLLTIPRIAITGSISFLAADIRTVFRPAVPAHALFVIDAAVRVQPDDLVARAVDLRGGLRVEHRKATGRGRGRRRPMTHRDSR